MTEREEELARGRDPMLLARIFGWLLVGCVVLAEANVWGFHSPSPLFSQVTLIGGAILLTVCRAHDSILRANKDTQA